MQGQQAQILPSLTGLRGIAALWVYFFHLTTPGKETLNIGYLGVDLFFIISGFVLCHVYSRQLRSKADYVAFLRARLARVYPLHLVTLLFVLGLTMWWPGFAQSYPSPEQRFGLQAFLAQLLLVQNWGYFLPTSFNVPAWSLSAEWAAYLVFPLFLWFAARLPKPAFCAFGCMAALALALALKGVHPGAIGAPGMVRLFFGFLSGCLLHAAWSRGVRLPPLAAGLGAVALLALGHVPGWNSVAALGFPAIVLLCAQGEGRIAQLCATDVAVGLGEVSFSVYLWHWPLIQMASRTPGVDLSRPEWVAALTAAVLLVGWLSYRFIERPARAWGRRVAIGRPVRAAAT